MMGDSTSEVKQYGSHLMLTGQFVNGFEGHIGYTEFMHCGQPQILGRYCMHFHMAGEILLPSLAETQSMTLLQE